MRRWLAASLLALALAGGTDAGLTPDLERQLREATYVYIQSERKNGEFGKPAEIWFLYDAGNVVVGTRPTSWRVKRIKWRKPRARIAVGKADGPSFEARGELVRDRALEEKLMTEFARKYPEGWARHAESFREGFKSGDRVLVRYTPAP